MTRKYLVLHMTDAGGSPLAQDDDQRMLERWAQKGADALGPGAPVAGPEQAKSVAVREGSTLVTDGPFPEFKEWFAGYDLIEAASIDEAAALMASHPTAVAGRLYILPVVTLPWEQDA